MGAAAYVAKSEAPNQLAKIIEQILQKSTFHNRQLTLVVDDSTTIRDVVKKVFKRQAFR